VTRATVARAPERANTGPPGHPLAVVGPTASGKTEAGVELARRLGAEVLVVDSMTVYRGMDVGTAKPSPDQRARVPHHLVDLADPVEPFSVARFQAEARQALRDLEARGVPALLVGGSGLYFRAVVDHFGFPGTDPEVRRLLEAEGAALGAARMHARLAAMDPGAAARMEPGNLRRSVRALEVAAVTGRPFSSFAATWDHYPGDRVRAAGIEMDPWVLRERIEARVLRMVESGLAGEVRALLDRGLRGFLTSLQAIGYLEMALHLEGKLSEDEMVDRTVRRTRHLARRQMAWFRRDPRIRWFPAGEGGAADAVDDIEEHLRG
jgi:tRNA dimethylallyltransferase